MRNSENSSNKTILYIPYLPTTTIQSDNVQSYSLYSIICGLCKGILYKPFQCIKCNKSFCKPCIQVWKNNNNRAFQCDCLNTSLIPACRAIRENLSYLKFNCPYNCSDYQYTYDIIVNHILICGKRKIPCPNCGKKMDNEKLKKINELNELRSNISILNDQIDVTKEELKALKEEIEKLNHSKVINKNYHSNQNSYSNQENKNENVKVSCYMSEKQNILFDKCEHFMGNYKPIFACCNMAFPCYLCHNEKQKHKYEFNNKVICLICELEYTGKTCPNCGAPQLYKKKKSV